MRTAIFFYRIHEEIIPVETNDAVSCILPSISMKERLQKQKIGWFQKQVHLQVLLEKLAPGVPPFNRKRSHNPIAYHKYMYPCCDTYAFYVMEYIITDNHFIRFWGYEVEKEKNSSILSSWYRTIGMMMIIETGMKRDPVFTPKPALEIPEIGREWISTNHDTKRDHLGAKYLKKYYKALAYNQFSLIDDLTQLYQHKGERLDQQFLQKLQKN